MLAKLDCDVWYLHRLRQTAVYVLAILFCAVASVGRHAGGHTGKLTGRHEVDMRRSGQIDKLTDRQTHLVTDS